MKEGIGPKVVIVVAVVAIAVAGYMGFKSFGGAASGAGGGGDDYKAPTKGVDMEQLNANPNSPPGISGAGGGS